jgi:multidrug efflux system membrane fusion protein
MNSSLTDLISQHTRKLAFTALFAVIAGVYYTGSASADDALPEAPPAPTVEVTTLAPQEIRSWNSFSGRLTAVESAAIKPLVGGTIQQVLFSEGQLVKKGDPLFVIDPRPHQASVKRAQAQLATARSRAKLAEDELNRSRQLVASKLVSQSIFDTAISNHQVAEAAVLEAESDLSQAKLDLEYAHISAPISGRVGRAELTIGNVVDAGAGAPVLTTIVADDQLYAEFNVNEQSYIQSVRSTQDQQEMPVELTLAQDTQVIYHGYIHAFDNRLDTSTGTIRARAIFANTDGALTPGMFANVRLGSSTAQATLLIPERAIGTNQSKKFVYIIDENNTANYREITLGDHYQGQRVAIAGVTAGERIVVNGLSHIRPNSVVNPVVAADSEQVATN